MKTFICGLFVALVTFTTVASASGPYFTIQQLLNNTDNDVGKISMLTYIMAVSDMNNESLTCVPAGTKAQVLYELTVAYVERVYVEKEEPAALTIRRALQRSYPCVKKVPML